MDFHVPVLLNEVIEALVIPQKATYVDMTFGRGGHSQAILDRSAHSHLYAFDRDRSAIASGADLVAHYQGRLTLIHDNFTQAKGHLASLGVTQVDGIVMDLGVSSPQFDDADRGFTYRDDTLLDMRMDTDQNMTAMSILATADVHELTRIFREYGDEPQAYQLAKAIVAERKLSPIETTGQLVAIIKSVKPNKELKKKGHPAKQAFQALRIAVNDELENLKIGLRIATSLLAPGGRLAVITFHSGEDRIVKNYFRELSTNQGSRFGPTAIIIPEEPEFAYYNRQVIIPSATEIATNHRAASAKLRIIQRKKR